MIKLIIQNEKTNLLNIVNTDISGVMCKGLLPCLWCAMEPASDKKLQAMKTCYVEGCISPVFSHHYCQRHQWKRTDIKKKPFKTVSEKKPKNTFDFGFNDQLTLFGQLWENAKDKNGHVICKFTGEKLNGFLHSDLWYNCFAHILSKKQYCYFKLNPDNVCIVFPEFHRIIDQGTTKDRASHPDWKWDAWDKRVLDLKEQYKQFKLKNLLA